MKSIWIVSVYNNNNVKRCFSQFRLSLHQLEIELGRYNNIGKNERKFKLCNCNMVESEYHVFLCSPIYNDLRRKYNIRCNWPKWTRFKYRLLSQNGINNVAKFISEAMKIREENLKLSLILKNYNNIFISFQIVWYFFICT